MRKTKFFLFISLLLIYQVSALGQLIDDWEGRPTFFLKHKLKNGIAFESKYEYRLDQNFSHYKKSALGLKTEYKINSKRPFILKPGLDYRFNFGHHNINHDFRYYFTLGYQVSKALMLEYTPLLQQEISRVNNPEYFLRNELEISYELDNLSLFLFTENYQKINKGLYFDTQKFGVGADYQFNKRNALEVKIDMKHKFDNKNIARILLGYIFIIP